MKRILIALALLLPATAHAQTTKALLNTEINTNLASGQAGGITALQLRTTMLDVVNSIMPTAPVVNLNLACFDGTTGLLKDCAVSPTTLTLPVGNITGLGTGVAAALAVNIGSAGAPVLFNGAGGTPASLVGTNITGTAAGLTAGTFTAGSATNLTSGALPAARMPALTGDVTTTVGTVATTLAAGSASNLNSGTLAVARGGVDQTAWSTYTPSSAFSTPGTSVMGAANGRWKQIGKVVFFAVDCTVTTVGTASGNWIIGLPTATNATSVGQTVGATGVEAIVSNALLAIQGVSTTTIKVNKYDGTSITIIGNGARVILLGTYEAN